MKESVLWDNYDVRQWIWTQQIYKKSNSINANSQFTYRLYFIYILVILVLCSTAGNQFSPPQKLIETA